MFGDKTFENILADMLENVPDKYDKREGSLIYTALSPIAMELAQAYVDMDMMLSETYADTASMEYLLKRAAERGLSLKEGARAVIRAKAVPEDVEIESGTLFNCGEQNYKVVQNEGEGCFLLQCDEMGVGGNTVADDLIPVSTVNGLVSLTFVEVVTPGTEDEDVELFRYRFFNSFKEKEYGGNIKDYQTHVNDIDGVGGCRVYPAWEGGGTVKIVIIGSDYRAASQSLIDVVRIDLFPDDSSEIAGAGFSPIGHYPTVVSAEEAAVNIAVTLELESGYVFEDVKNSMEQMVERYLEELSGTFSTESHLTVRRSRLESDFLTITGILDVTEVLINGSASNYVIEGDYIPVRGGD